MTGVRIEQKSYEMPPRNGFTVTHFITVADIDRSADFYEKVFGSIILSRGDSKGASGHIRITDRGIRTLLENVGLDIRAAWKDGRGWYTVTLARVR